jgi:hypothetical protein
MSASDDNTNSSSHSSSSGSSSHSSSGSAVPGEATVGGVSFEKCPPLPPQFAPQLQSAWAPAADPVLAYGTGRPASGTAQLQLQQQQPQQQQQKSDSKGRARRQRQQQEEDVPRQYATSTVFFAGVSPIATEAGLLSVFEQFGTVIRVNLFRPYKTCKTSKVRLQHWRALLCSAAYTWSCTVLNAHLQLSVQVQHATWTCAVLL